MKRAGAWLALLGLVGLVGGGQPPLVLWNPGAPIPPGAGGGPVEVTSSFTIPGAFLIFAQGDLSFPAEELAKVTSAGFKGQAETNTLAVYGMTNRAVSVTGEVWGFKGKGDCGKLLPTRVHGYLHRWQPGWMPFMGGWYDVGEYLSTTVYLPKCAGGYYFGWMELFVDRDGYNDPTDIYEARVKITVTGM